MLSRRSLLLGGLAALSASHARTASATLVRALTLTELVAQSRHAVVGTPADSVSRWETVGRRERIVTYTRVRVEYSLDGLPPAASELMVRTLGGRVDDIGQVVPGEAPLRRNATAALFVEELARDLFVVTAMAQGHYPIVADLRGDRRLHANLSSLATVTPDAAVVRLDKRTVLEVEGLVYEEVVRGAR